MRQRHEFLDQLRISESCAESWDGMVGGDGCRFCSRCQREVFDFAQLTQRQIEARLEASRGRICARLTRAGGKLRTLPAFLPAPASRRPAGKRSPLAAALLGAWLGAGSPATAAHAVPAETLPLENPSAGAPRPGKRDEKKSSPQDAMLTGFIVYDRNKALPGTAVTLREVVTGRERVANSGPDGSFVFERLPAGLYDLEASIEGFEIETAWDLLLEPGETRRADLEATVIEDMSSTGVVGFDERSLRDYFEESELAVIAVVESWDVVAIEGNLAEVATRLRILKRFKGQQTLPVVTYRHSVYVDSLDPRFTVVDPSYVTGEELLAFLVLSDEGSAARPVYKEVGYSEGVRRLEIAERGSYLHRVEALAEIDRAARKSARVDPAAVMDWLVATAEDPHTRHEAIREITSALRALEDLAKKERRESVALARGLLQVAADADAAKDGKADGLRPLFLGAAITPLHLERLEGALAGAAGPLLYNQRLYWLVRGWNRPAADSWLAEALRADAEITDLHETYYWLLDVAESLATEKAALFAASAEEHWDAFSEQELAAEEPATDDQLEARRRVLVRALMLELSDLL